MILCCGENLIDMVPGKGDKTPFGSFRLAPGGCPYNSAIVKASETDLEWMYGPTPLEAVISRILTLGPEVVFVTFGGKEEHHHERAYPDRGHFA